MSIKSLIGHEFCSDTDVNKVEGHQLPTKFGAILNRYQDLKQQQAGGRYIDNSHVYKPIEEKK